LRQMVDCAIIADSNRYGHCEDIQLIIDHIISEWMAKIRIIGDE
jgi:hypothetical protein